MGTLLYGMTRFEPSLVEMGPVMYMATLFPIGENLGNWVASRDSKLGGLSLNPGFGFGQRKTRVRVYSKSLSN